LGMMRTQLVQLPFIMPRMPSVRAMCTKPCGGGRGRRWRGPSAFSRRAARTQPRGALRAWFR
jgi:hypothetical protein